MMDTQAWAAAGLAAVIAGIAIYSLRGQLRQLRRLRAETMAADDRRYHRNRAYRRAANGVLMLLLAGLIAGSHLSGLEGRIDQIGDDPTPEQRDLARFYALYWIAVLVLIFLVVVIALMDLIGTWLYGHGQMRRLRAEHQERLDRDLAVVRGRRGGPRGRGL